MIPRYNPLPRTTKPLPRSYIRPKKRERTVSWRSGTVREDAAGMARLRAAAFARSTGICECGTPDCEALPARLRRVTWRDGQLHHSISRGRGGSDVLSNVVFVTRDCHKRLTGELQWKRRRSA